MANNVEEQALADPLFCPIDPTGVHERILVCISTHPDAQRLIRRGFRIADRMCGELIILFVKLQGKKLPEEYAKNLKGHQELTAALGGRFLEVEAFDISDAIVDIAKKQKVTQIIVGESMKEPCFFNPFKPAIPYQIFKRTANIDVYIVATNPAQE